MFGSWEDAYVRSGRFYANDHNYKFENRNSRMEDQTQISHIQSFIQEDVNGIAVGPVSATAIVDIVEQAAEENIPVISCNSDVQTSELDMSVYIGNDRATEQLGEELVNHLQNNVNPEGAVEGTVLDLQGDLSTTNGKNREAGFRKVVDKHSGVNVIEARANFSASPAQDQTFSKLQATSGRIDAIFAANGAMASGAASALERYGSSPGDIFMACMDGSPTVIDLFDKGWLQRGFAQPTQFYLPLALSYLEKIRTDGKESLPEIGTEVGSDDLGISGENHLGVDIWAKQDWAPGSILERNGHRYFQTNGKLLTPDNYDRSSNWGVLFGQPEV
jgi:ABC-type sugar transport system substrate-binding protein